MRAVRSARRYFLRRPVEAWSDILGLGAVGALVWVGFTLPGLV